MSKTLICDIDSRFQMDSFILIRPESKFYKVGEKFMFVDNNQLFQKMAYLKSVQNYSLKNLPEVYTYLDSNVPKHKYLEIQEKVYNASQRLTLKEYPVFLIHLKDVLGIRDFKVFEARIFSTFMPMKLIEILELYKNGDLYIHEKYVRLQFIVKEAYVEKSVSILTFSTHVPENIIIERLKNNF